MNKTIFIDGKEGFYQKIKDLKEKKYDIQNTKESLEPYLGEFKTFKKAYQEIEEFLNTYPGLLKNLETEMQENLDQKNFKVRALYDVVNKTLNDIKPLLKAGVKIDLSDHSDTYTTPGGVNYLLYGILFSFSNKTTKDALYYGVGVAYSVRSQSIQNYKGYLSSSPKQIEDIFKEVRDFKTVNDKISINFEKMINSLQKIDFIKRGKGLSLEAKAEFEFFESLKKQLPKIIREIGASQSDIDNTEYLKGSIELFVRIFDDEVFENNPHEEDDDGAVFIGGKYLTKVIKNCLPEELSERLTIGFQGQEKNHLDIYLGFKKR